MPYVELAEVQIGEGNFRVDLPAHYHVETEEDRTVAAYDPNAETGLLRFTVFYFTGEQVRGEARPGIKAVREAAAEKRKKLQRHDSKEYFTDSETVAEDDGTRGTLHVWEVGFEESVILISCWVRRAGARSPAARLALKCAEDAVRNLRNAPFHTYDAPEGMAQEVLPLRAEDEVQLDAWRTTAHQLVMTVLQRPRLMGSERDLNVIQELLDHEARNSFDDAALRGLGVVFGEHLARKLGLHWVTVSDAWGVGPALSYQGLKLILYPADMLLKRVERGEAFDVVALFNATIDMVHEEAMSGKVKQTSSVEP